MECPGGADRGGVGGVRFWFGKGERLWKEGWWFNGWKGEWGDVGIAPYEIPPALRATSLFKGGLKTPPP